MKAKTSGITAPIIVVHCLKTNKQLSDETLCYTAVIEVNGVKAIRAENRGNGGGDVYRPYHAYERPPNDKEQLAFDRAMGELAAYAKLLPPEIYEGYSIQPNVESLIIEAVVMMSERKRLRGMLKRATVMMDPEGTLFKIQLVYKQELLPSIEKTYPGHRVLNAMPEDVALRLLMGK